MTADDTQHAHRHSHGHGHSHSNGHGHGHSHSHGDDFDWAAMAEHLEIDGELALPLVATIVSELGAVVTGAHHIVDVGAGPGVITCALAGHAPQATVTALDTAEPLLHRVAARAAAHELDTRVATVVGDLEAQLPELAADVVWASMVVHHVADRVATLRRLHDALRPGGTLVMVEFGGQPTVLPEHHPATGAWQRMHTQAEATLQARLGFDVPHHPWPEELAAAGFTDVVDRPVVFHHPAPLGDVARRWLPRHVRRGIGWAGESLSADDAAALEALAQAVEGGNVEGLAIRAERRVLTARRPS